MGFLVGGRGPFSFGGNAASRPAPHPTTGAEKLGEVSRDKLGLSPTRPEGGNSERFGSPVLAGRTDRTESTRLGPSTSLAGRAHRCTRSPDRPSPGAGSKNYYPHSRGSSGRGGSSHRRSTACWLEGLLFTPLQAEAVSGGKLIGPLMDGSDRVLEKTRRDSL